MSNQCYDPDTPWVEVLPWLILRPQHPAVLGVHLNPEHWRSGRPWQHGRYEISRAWLCLPFHRFDHLIVGHVTCSFQKIKVSSKPTYPQQIKTVELLAQQFTCGDLHLVHKRNTYIKYPKVLRCSTHRLVLMSNTHLWVEKASHHWLARILRSHKLRRIWRRMPRLAALCPEDSSKTRTQADGRKPYKLTTSHYEF